MRRLPKVGAGIAIALISGASVMSLPLAAHAALATTIQFVDTTPQVVEYGDAWSFTAVTSIDYGGGIASVPDPTLGTVSVTLTGIGGDFATGLPIQPDGRVYISQPLDRPLLPAGEYDLTAIFVPSPGTTASTSQTPATTRLTITPLAAKATVEVANDTAVSAFPVITASLSGSYVDKRGGAPAGTWSFLIRNDVGDTVFEGQVGQPEGGADAVRLELKKQLAAGTEYTVSSTFTVVDEYVGGVESSEIADVSFTTPGSTIVDTLNSRLAFPGWIVIAVGVILVGLVAIMVTLAVKLSRRVAPAPSPSMSDVSSIVRDDRDASNGLHSDEPNQT